MAMNLEDISVGKVNFVEQHGLWSDAQKEAAERVKAEIEEKKLRTIRVGWGDQHGIVRGKNVMTHDFLHVLRNGQDFQTATLFMDTTNNLFAPMFASGGGIGMAQLAGGPDSILVPDPTTFRVLPWVPHTPPWSLTPSTWDRPWQQHPSTWERPGGAETGRKSAGR